MTVYGVKPPCLPAELHTSYQFHQHEHHELGDCLRDDPEYYRDEAEKEIKPTEVFR